MRREDSALVFEGTAESMPGELWTLYHSTGERRTLLLDSTFEASVFARYFGVPLSFAVPAVVDPRRALDYTNIEESMYVPRVGIGVTLDNGARKGGGSQMVTSGDRQRSADLEKTA